MKISRRQFGLTALMSMSFPPLEALAAQINIPSLAVRDIGDGIRLHYEERGSGTPIIFVHGSLSDYTYWQQQMEPFATKYRAIVYSRRYNFPNSNPAQSGYSAIMDADDLARLVRTLGLGKIVVIGHSYGALTALFFATRHPELVSAMVLAEPPVISLLNHLSEQRSAEGNAMFQDIQTHMVAPMKVAFAKGDRTRESPHSWTTFSTTPLRGRRCRRALVTRRCAMLMNGMS